MDVEWNRCARNWWCEFKSVDLGHALFDVHGICVVWDREVGAVLKVSEGHVRQKLTEIKESAEFEPHKDHDVRFTWAEVADEERAGCAAYLAERLDPKFGDQFPDVKPVRINLPG